jgi:lipoate-protein ligase A
MARPARLLIDEAADGAWNMAVDEALLESAAGGEVPTLRFYRWNPPTLSLGYFQVAADRDAHPPSRGCPMVRRASGGGAILHDQEITYSFVLPAARRRPGAAGFLYDAAHETLIELLDELGVSCRLCERTSRLRPFLCFQRRSPGDVLLGEDKVAGSAQRRHAGALLQHGSILLRRSRFAPELPGLADLAGPRFPDTIFPARWLPRLAERLGVDLKPGCLSDREVRRARQLVADKFGHSRWNDRR